MRMMRDTADRTTRYQYDDLDRVTDEIQPDPDGLDGALHAPATHYSYDGNGNLVSTSAGAASSTAPPMPGR